MGHEEARTGREAVASWSLWSPCVRPPTAVPGRVSSRLAVLSWLASLPPCRRPCVSSCHRLPSWVTVCRWTWWWKTRESWYVVADASTRFMHQPHDRVEPPDGIVMPHLPFSSYSATTSMPLCHRCGIDLPADGCKLGQHRRRCKMTMGAAAVSASLRKRRKKDVHLEENHRQKRRERIHAREVWCPCLF